MTDQLTVKYVNVNDLLPYANNARTHTDQQVAEIAASIEPFAGSGSTLMRAERLGRKCYGMEIDPIYCDVIVKRWEDFTGKKAQRVQPAHTRA